MFYVVSISWIIYAVKGMLIKKIKKIAVDVELSVKKRLMWSVHLMI